MTRASQRAPIPTTWRASSSASWPRAWASRPPPARPAARTHQAWMASEAPARLTSLLTGPRRLALVGLAKNTGKTETLAAILAEHAAAGALVGVTSIGRDGEAHDVIDARIEKPRVRLAAGSLVATTGELLRSSGLVHERLVQTGMRTPLGEVVIARISQAGTVEVAGPSAAADVRAVSDAMAELGARHVLIDGAIDRRAASSPEVADGLVMATGAVLGAEIEQVVAATVDAVDLVRLPRSGWAGDGAQGMGADARSAEGVPLTAGPWLVSASRPCDRGRAHDRPEGDHDQPRRAAVTPLRLTAAARADRSRGCGRARLRRAQPPQSKHRADLALRPDSPGCRSGIQVLSPHTCWASDGQAHRA